jgi:hypothetical protein
MGYFTPSEEFTPTWEEWLTSTITLPNPYIWYTDKSGESAFYGGINFSLLTAQVLMYGTDTAAGYRGWLLLRSMPSVIAASALSDAYDAGDGIRLEQGNVLDTTRISNPIVQALRSTWHRLT